MHHTSTSAGTSGGSCVKKATAAPVWTPLTLQPDETTSKDTWVGDQSPTLAHGDEVILDTSNAGANHRKALIQFDLSGVTEDRPTWTLTLTQQSSIGANRSYALYAILSANSAWTEAGATWNTQDGVSAWAGSAGLGTSGVDYNATALVTFTITSGTAANTAHDLTLSAAQMNAMRVANYGMLLLGTTAGTGHAFHSAGAVTGAYRPKLYVG